MELRNLQRRSDWSGVAKRNCGSCRYFRDIGLGQTGHCTNAQVVTNKGSLVLFRRDELGCRGGWGSDQWEPRGSATIVAAPTPFAMRNASAAAGSVPAPLRVPAAAPRPFMPRVRAPEDATSRAAEPSATWDDDGRDPKRAKDARDALRRARAARRHEARSDVIDEAGDGFAAMPPAGAGGGVRVLDPPPPPRPVGRLEVQDHRAAAMNGRFGSDVAMSFSAAEESDPYLLDVEGVQTERAGPEDLRLTGSVPITRPGQSEPQRWGGRTEPPPFQPEERIAATPSEPTPGGWLSPTPSPVPVGRDSWGLAELPPIPSIAAQPWQEDSVVAEYLDEIGEPADDVWRGEGWVEKETGGITWNEPIPLAPNRTPPPPRRRRGGWLGGIRPRAGDRQQVDDDSMEPMQGSQGLRESFYDSRPDPGYWGASPEKLFGDDEVQSPSVMQMSAAAPAATVPAAPVERIDPWLDPDEMTPVSGRWRDPEFVPEPKVDPTTGMVRMCETCRSFRPQQGGRGTCSHPYAFSHTRVVTERMLACSSSMGSWWSPSDRVWQAMADIDRHSNPTPLLDEFLNPEPASETDDRSRTR